MVWGGLIRIFLYQHATFSVNSICHMFGRQDYRSRDEARNNWVVALLVFGEGWHNNHHAFPASARHGLAPPPARPLLVGDPRPREDRARLGRARPVAGPGRAPPHQSDLNRSYTVLIQYLFRCCTGTRQNCHARLAVPRRDVQKRRRCVARRPPPAAGRAMKVAVVGAGVSGLGAAYLLSRAHEVEVFESDARAGGHTRTVRRDGLALDTGFLVHNERNYPLLTRLFGELGVATQASEMSFSVSCPCGLEYSGRRPFAQPGRVADRRFHRLLWEIGRWLRTARARSTSSTASAGRSSATSTSAATRTRSAVTSSCRSPQRSGRPRRAARSNTRPRRRSASSTTTGCSASAAFAGGR